MRQLSVGLTAEQRAARKNGLGGSDANKIMSADPRALYCLWEEKTGKAEPEDLSNILPVVLGSYTEPLNIYWYEKQTGRAVTDEGRSCASKNYPFMLCTLDGLTTTEAGEPAILECKHVNAFGAIEEVVQKYMPQLFHNMIVCGLDHAVLSVFQGTQKWELYEVEMDVFYAGKLIEAEAEFWRCVLEGVPPEGFQAVEAPKITKFREVDMSGSNSWASNAADWLGSRKAAKTFETAAKELKSLVESDVGKAFGHGICATRAKNGALSIREINNAA